MASREASKPAVRKATSAPVRYRIVATHPKAHCFEVRCDVAHPDPVGQVFALPAWVPGSYMIREFAKHIVEIRAESGGRRVKLAKLDKHTWRAEPCVKPLTLVYIVYAWDLSVRAAHLDESHGFFNGTSVFLRVAGREREPHIVDIVAPRGAKVRGWRIATALPELAAKRHGFGTYRAANYDELIDHPVEMGNFIIERFDACGVPHEIAITGQVPKLDVARLVLDLKTICTAQLRFFESQPDQARGKESSSPDAPFLRYVFLATAVGEGHGGLEHRASTALLFSRDSLPVVGQAESSGAYRNFLGLVSHEYFHSWNVKRIKPAAFAPYDLDRENPTSLLWIFEGFTSYYDALFLMRTGRLTREQYLESLAKTITEVLSGSGRKKQSVAESSFDAWIKYYRQDENAPNAVVSYYKKGSLVALALDLHLREKSAGARSLDDVMRLLWQRYGRTFYPEGTHGLAEDGFAAIVREATGTDVAREVREWAYGTADLPLARLFAHVGVTMRIARKHGGASLAAQVVASGADCKLAHVYDDGAAQRAGLSAGDMLVAIDGLRVVPGKLDALLARYAPGDTVVVHAFRRDELVVRSVELDGAPLQAALAVESVGTALAKKAKAREGWLRGPLARRAV